MTRERSFTTIDGDGSDGRGRGQSPVIGVVLLLGIVVVGSIGILLVGTNAQEEGQKESRDRQVKLTFLQLDQRISSVARTQDQNPTRAGDLDLPEEADTAIQVNNVGRVWVNKTNFTTRKNVTIVDKSVGEIRFRQDDGNVYSYQSGAVF